MDYISVSSEIIESWDFTQGPVRGLRRDLCGERSINDIFQYSDIIWSKGVRKKLSRRKDRYSNRQIVESSTSLILKKTIKTPNTYSEPSYSDIILPHKALYGGSDNKYTTTDGKPLIKVTVIPQTKQPQYVERPRPPRNITRTQTPITDPNQAFNTRNFYLLVAGCKNKKIYELNTRSAVGETGNNDAFLNENEYTEYYKANMKKNKRNLMTNNYNLVSDDDVTGTCTPNCKCPDCRQRNSMETKTTRNNVTRQGIKLKNIGRNNLDGFRIELPSPESRTSGSNKSRTEEDITRKGVGKVGAPKSRIKITGRLGLTAEDKYVLKCNATLDDKPIATHYQTSDCETAPCRSSTNPIEVQRSPMDLCYRAAQQRPQRDSNIQVDTRYFPCNVFEAPPKKQRDSNIQVDTRFIPCPAFEVTYQCQATQASLNLPRLSRAVNDDKIMQCCCPSTAEISTYTSDDNGNEELSLKPCPSPIVIISVYPNQESTDVVTKKKASSVEEKYTTQIEYGQKGKEKKPVNKTKIPKAVGRSRPPSPVKVTKKDKDTQFKSTNTASKPVCDSAAKGRKKTKSSNVQTVNHVKTTVASKKTEQRSKSPTKSPSPGRRKDNPKTKTNLSTGTNTEQMLVKKALVEDFTKQITEMKDKRPRDGSYWGTKHNISNVTVNIEGDNEHYNVTFRQGELDTDLIVRKTNKGIMTKPPGDEEHPSIHNFLFSHPDDHRKRSYSQTHIFQGNNPVGNRSSSNVNVVDSLEISHRREEKTIIVGQTTQTNVKNAHAFNEVDNTYLAPIKHFHGDECSITDPIERDLEIRALLGIEKGRFKPPGRSTRKARKPFGLGSEVSLHYLYHQIPSKSPAKKSRPKNKILVGESMKQDAVYTPEKKASLYQQLVLSKNFQVLLELKRSKKEKPILLTHQQYAKVRKTLCNVLVKKSVSRHTKVCSLKCSLISVGKVRTKPKEILVHHYNKESQTDAVGVSCSLIQTDTTFGKRDLDLSSNADDEEVLKLIKVFSKRDDCSNSNLSEPTYNIVDVKDSDDSKHKTVEGRDNFYSIQLAHTDKKGRNFIDQHDTKMLFNASQATNPKKSKSSGISYLKRAFSSLEVHYASASYIRRVKFSSSDIDRCSISARNSVNHNLDQKESASIHTIFNGHRKIYTPNLGASAYSLCPDGAFDRSDTRFHFFDDSNINLKPKKPFFRRLISCLVLRASKASNTKFPTGGPVLNKPSINSSLDSYHINTSLGAVDMSSSIYDTTASFYSNHTILPARRMRRGFFYSVRGFLNRS